MSQHEIGEHAPQGPSPETVRAQNIAERVQAKQWVSAYDALWLAKNYPWFLQQKAQSETPAYTLTPHERYEASATGTEQAERLAWTRKKEQEQSVTFYGKIGYPQYGGKYAPFAIPTGYTVKAITETPSGLQISLQGSSKPPEEHPSLSEQIMGLKPLPLGPFTKRQQEFSAAFVGSAESLVYGLLGMVGVKGLPKPPITTIGALETSALGLGEGQRIGGYLSKALWSMPYVSQQAKAIHEINVRAGLEHEGGIAITPEIEFLAAHPYYAVGSLVGDIALTYGISKAVSFVTETVGPKLVSGTKEVVGFVYEKAVEPEVLKASKVILGEEAYAYYHGVEGMKAIDLLKLGITENMTGPVYHGILEILPYDVAEGVSFGKSVVLPNLRNLGVLARTSIVYTDVLEPLGSHISEFAGNVAEPFAERISYARGAVSFIWQAEGPFQDVRFILQDIGTYPKAFIAGAAEKVSVVKGSISFLEQAPFDIATTPLGSVSEALAKGSNFIVSPIKEPVGTVKGTVSFLSQSHVVVPQPLKEISETVVTGVSSGTDYLRQVVIIPLKAEKMVDVAIIMQNWTLGLRLASINFRYVSSFLKPVTEETTTRSGMKPWDTNYKPVKFDVRPIEQAKNVDLAKMSLRPKAFQQPETAYAETTEGYMSSFGYPSMAKAELISVPKQVEFEPVLVTGALRLSSISKIGLKDLSLADTMSRLHVSMEPLSRLGFSTETMVTQESLQKQVQKQIQQTQMNLPTDTLQKRAPHPKKRMPMARGINVFLWEFPILDPEKVLKMK